MLHDQVNLSLRVDGVIELHDVLMARELSHEADLSLYTLSPLNIGELVLIVDLHCDSVKRRAMLGLLDHCIGPLSENFTEAVICNRCVVECPVIMLVPSTLVRWYGTQFLLLHRHGSH